MLLLLKGETRTVSVDPQKVYALTWDSHDGTTDIWTYDTSPEGEPALYVDLSVEEVTDAINQALKQNEWPYGYAPIGGGSITITPDPFPDCGELTYSDNTLPPEDHE